MKNILMSMALAATLAIGVIAADGGRNPTFASTGVCGSGPGPVCDRIFSCTDWSWEIGWPLKIVRTCASWREQVFYWEPNTGSEDPALPPGEEEPEPEQPQEPDPEG